MWCERYPGCGCGTQSGPHACEGSSTQDERARNLAMLITAELPFSLFNQHQRDAIRAKIRPFIDGALREENRLGFETAQNILSEARKQWHR